MDDDDDVHEWAGYAHRTQKLHTVQISFYLRQNTHICVHNLALSFSLHSQLHSLRARDFFYGGFTIHGVNMIVQMEPIQALDTVYDSVLSFFARFCDE